jgi:hypothetical protein
MFSRLENKHGKNDLKILHLNIRSLPRHFEQLLSFIGIFGNVFDIISLNETWLNSHIDTLYEIPNFSHITINRPNFRRGGGLRVYYRSHLTVTACEDLTGVFNTHESIFACVSNNNKKLVFGTIYRPPNLSIADFNNYLSNVLFVNRHILNDKCIITGDININFLLCNELESHRMYKNIMIENGFEMFVKNATRCNEQTGQPISILDHVFTNFTESVLTNVIDYKISDHLPIMFSCQLAKSNNIIKQVFYDFSVINFNRFLLEAPTLYGNYTIIDSNNVDLEMSRFIDWNHSLIKRFFPTKIKHISLNRLKTPWINKRILKLINKKHKLFTLLKYKVIPYIIYKAFSNLLDTILTRMRREYYKDKFQRTSDSRKTWRVINEILGRNGQGKQIIKEIIIDGETNSDQSSMAQAFNEYFCQIPIKTQNNLNKALVSYDNIIQINDKSMSLYFTTPIEIYDIINKLSNKSCKHDIPMKLIKSVNELISPLLHKIFNMCIEKGIYPELLKSARVIPIHKSGDCRLMKNYRPISTLLNINKIFEKLLYQRLNSFLESCNIISDNQYGFRKNRDTQLATLNLIYHILPTVSSGEGFSACAFLDFSKAFDTVDHKILLMKLERYGIRGLPLSIIGSYLDNRKQSVEIDSTKSISMPVEVGVPQGSCLGPLLFLLYANDLNYLLKDTNTVIFADDTTIVEKAMTIESLALKLNSTLSKILDWSNYNKLSLNNNKSKWMLITNREIHIPNIFIGGQLVERVDTFKYLGLHIDSNLKYRSHLNYLRGKLSSLRYISYKISPYLNDNAGKKFYYALVQSILSYGIVVWGGTSVDSALFNKLCRLQNKIVFNLFANQDDNSGDETIIYKRHHILKLSDLYKLRVSMIMYKIMHENYAPFIYERLASLLNSNPYATRHDYIFVRPFPRVNAIKFDFISNAVTIWNNLNNEIRNGRSLATVKKNLTSSFIDSY